MLRSTLGLVAISCVGTVLAGCNDRSNSGGDDGSTEGMADAGSSESGDTGETGGEVCLPGGGWTMDLDRLGDGFRGVEVTGAQGFAFGPLSDGSRDLVTLGLGLLGPESIDVHAGMADGSFDTQPSDEGPWPPALGEPAYPGVALQAPRSLRLGALNDRTWLAAEEEPRGGSDVSYSAAVALRQLEPTGGPGAFARGPRLTHPSLDPNTATVTLYAWASVSASPMSADMHLFSLWGAKSGSDPERAHYLVSAWDPSQGTFSTVGEGAVPELDGRLPNSYLGSDEFRVPYVTLHTGDTTANIYRLDVDAGVVSISEIPQVAASGCGGGTGELLSISSSSAQSFRICRAKDGVATIHPMDPNTGALGPSLVYPRGNDAPTTVVFEDFDFDTELDALVGYSDRIELELSSEGAGRPVVLGTNLRPVAIEDVSGDDMPEVVVSTGSSAIAVVSPWVCEGG